MVNERRRVELKNSKGIKCRGTMRDNVKDKTNRAAHCAMSTLPAMAVPGIGEA